MKKNKKTILVIIIVILAFGAGLTWRWIQQTPYFALYQIGAGLKNRDLNTVLTYVDLESILNQQISGTLSGLLSSLAASSPLGKISGQAGEIKIQITPESNKGLKGLVLPFLQHYLENPQNPTLPSSFALVYLAQVKVKDDNALVTLMSEKDQLRLGMHNQAGVWRIVEINSEDAQRLIKTYLIPRIR
jgi:hypothetical protein